MINQDIFDLMDRFERSSLRSLKLSTQEFKLELTQGQDLPCAPAVPAVQAAAPAAPAVPGDAAPARTEAPAITAPLVGTFYAAPAPDQPPFVSVGDRVEKGQTVCLIEAMKMMSEVPAPCACIIEEVCRTSGELVPFGEPLFRYRAV